jgi:hypothetical protein
LGGEGERGIGVKELVEALEEVGAEEEPALAATSRQQG